MKLMYSRFMNEESGLKKTRSEWQEGKQEALLVRARYKVCYEVHVKCRGSIKGMFREFSNSTSKSEVKSGNVSM